MRNTLGDLNNHLFAQLERLGEEDLSGVKLSEEINRAKAMSQVASQIIANGKLVLEAIQVADEKLGSDNEKVPRMLEGK